MTRRDEGQGAELPRTDAMEVAVSEYCVRGEATNR